MIRNMGTADRAIRAVVVAPLLVVAALAAGAGTALGIVLLAFAAVMLLTAATAHCPLYRLVGLSTHPRTPAPR
jgi:predicted lysophospholipase L1 biosynthesis ABC-type transport system permease subunit